MDDLSDEGMGVSLFGAEGLGRERGGGCVSYVSSLRVRSRDVEVETGLALC